MTQTIAPAPVKRTLTVAATPERAFEVFTNGLDRWWPRRNHIGKTPMARAVLEPRVGGRWYEVGEDGAECDWGDVLVWDPPSRLVMAWRITSSWAFDSAAHSEVEVLFTALPDGSTRVDFEHRGLEGLGDGHAASRALGGGWPTTLDLFRAAAEAEGETR